MSRKTKNKNLSRTFLFYFFNSLNSVYVEWTEWQNGEKSGREEEKGKEDNQL